MKHLFLKAAAVSPALKVADVPFNVKEIIKTVRAQQKKGAELLVFPELCLCGYTADDLLLQNTLVSACLNGLTEIAEATENTKMLVFVGLPVLCRNKLYNCAAGVANGKVLGFVPKTYLPNYGEFYEQRYFAQGFEGEDFVRLADGSVAPISGNLLFREKTHPEVCVACEICEDVWAVSPPSDRHVRSGAAVIVNLSASDETVGKREYRKTLLSAQSGRGVCAYVYADAGTGESTSDTVFSGNHLIYENGTLLAEAKPFSGEAAVAEIDVGFLLHERKRLNTLENIVRDGREACETQAQFMGDGDLSLRNVPKNPFLPEGDLGERFELILTIQAQALKKRLEHTRAKTAVIGVSGGLDSSLAFLVTVRAFDLLKKSRKDIIALTMPGFGTTKKTKQNSVELMEAMGATAREVDITPAVKQHFRDIGHDETVLDSAYENAQARYRTMVLMDVANETGGLVVGTGDLSELALGWCTYNGDHMSMYAVNCSVPKTLVKALVSYEAARLGGAVRLILESVAGTDISPELLPPDQEGKIAQKTEDLVGPYELHDFFLYRFLRCGDSPAKIYYLATYAYRGVYSGETVKKWLKVFFKRFFSQQFKRNCVPDGVKVGSVALSPRGDWRMPSDAEAKIWLDEIEAL